MFGNLVELSYANDLVPLSAVDMLRFSLIYRYTTLTKRAFNRYLSHAALECIKMINFTPRCCIVATLRNYYLDSDRIGITNTLIITNV